MSLWDRVWVVQGSLLELFWRPSGSLGCPWRPRASLLDAFGLDCADGGFPLVRYRIFLCTQGRTEEVSKLNFEGFVFIFP